MAIMLSEAAAKEIKHIIQEQGLPQEQTRLRVGVKGGGCSGFSYMLDLTEEQKSEADEEMEAHGVKILCDMKSYLYLNGTEKPLRLLYSRLPATTPSTVTSSASNPAASARFTTPSSRGSGPRAFLRD